MNKFYTPDLSDKRMSFAKSELENMGYKSTQNIDDAEFLLIPPNNKNYVGDVRVPRYYNDEEFLLENAYLTAEGAVATAINESDASIIHSNVLIIGYGRIGKALHHYLSSFTKNITVCARNENQRALARCDGANGVNFDALTIKNNYDYVFNTVPFPIIADKQLSALKPDCLIIELASLPGGVDKHMAKLKNIRLIEARGLPAKCSPKTAGILLAKAVHKVIREGNI